MHQLLRYSELKAITESFNSDACKWLQNTDHALSWRNEQHMIGMMFVLEHHSFFQEKLQASFHYKTKDIVSYIHACKLLLSHVGAISGHGELQAKSR